MLLSVVFWSGALAVALWIGHWVHSWRHPKCSGKLPPGSMGLPLVGESLSFFARYSSFDVSPFLKDRVQRYGPIFKTSLVGQSIIVTTDPELNHFIFQQEGRLFECWYPYTFISIFGRRNMAVMHGFMHKYLKSLVLRLFGVDGLRGKLLPEIEKFALQRLDSWLNQPSINLKEATAAMIFDFTAKKLIGYEPSDSTESLQKNFVAFIDGLISFPVNIPGTSFYKCMQGREDSLKILKGLLKERRESSNSGQGDFFDHIIEDLQKEGTLLTDEIALDLVFVLLFASYETTSLAITMAVKFVTHHPKVLQELLEEHQEIIRNRENRNSGITWKEYKSMTFTSQVINETVRLANIAPFIFRRALKDFETKAGHTIPAGWGVMVCPPAIHMNPNVYEDPFSFNPWRWEGIDTYGGSKDFMAFGGGMRHCVGADFSRLQMAVFLHHLVTKYRWTEIKGGEIVRKPGLEFPNGYHIKLKQMDQD